MLLDFKKHKVQFFCLFVVYLVLAALCLRLCLCRMLNLIPLYFPVLFLSLHFRRSHAGGGFGSQLNEEVTVKIKSVPLPLLYSVVIYCTLFCFLVARRDLSANIATFVFEMICFNKESVFQ